MYPAKYRFLTFLTNPTNSPKSRIASFLGFSFHFYFNLYPSFTLWLKSILDFNSAIVIIVLTIMFINGIRGTVAYHNYKRRLT